MGCIQLFHSKPNRRRPIQFQQLRVNNRIRARELLVIGPDGASLGIIPVNDALAHARRAGMDLVEISPKARPPVCKILDYGKFRYEMSKKDKEARKQNNAAKVKELKFHINIDEHDYMTKMRHAEDFLFRGMKAKLMMVFRGREMQHQDLGKTVVARIRKDLEHVGIADAEPKLVGRNINLMLTPVPLKKRVRKYTDDSIEYEGDDATEEGGESEDSGEENKINEKR